MRCNWERIGSSLKQRKEGVAGKVNYQDDPGDIGNAFLVEHGLGLGVLRT